MCHNSQFVGNPPRRCLCLFPPPGLPTNSNILRRISPMMLLMVTMISVIFKMSGVAQSGFCRKFPFWAFCPFFPTAENGPQEKLLPVHYFCSSLIVHTHVCHISNAWTNGEQGNLLIAHWHHNTATLGIIQLTSDQRIYICR